MNEIDDAGAATFALALGTEPEFSDTASAGDKIACKRVSCNILSKSLTLVISEQSVCLAREYLHFDDRLRAGGYNPLG